MINKNQVRSGRKAILKIYQHFTYIIIILISSFIFGKIIGYIEHIQIENKSNLFVVQNIILMATKGIIYGLLGLL